MKKNKIKLKDDGTTQYPSSICPDTPLIINENFSWDKEKKKAYNRGYKVGRKYTGIHFYQTSTPKNKLIICKNT